jgi:hypothetical protein
MLPKTDLAAGRAAIARASRRAREHPDDPTRIEVLNRTRREYAEAVLTEHIERVVAAAPPLTDEQRARLTLLLSSSGGEAA